MSETFDLMAFVEGSSYPTKTITMYTDVAAMERAEELYTKIAEPGISIDELKTFEAELDEVKAAIEKSAINFNLRGMPWMVASEIANVFAEEGSDDAPTEENIFELIKQSIVSVTNHAGAETSLPDVEGLRKIRKFVSPLEFTKLINGTMEVCFAAVQYEAEIDAGFPGGSSDVE